MTTDGEFIQPELPSAPVVSGATNDSITLMWDAWDASTDIGDPPLMQYRVYYMNNSQEEEVRRSDRLAPSETVTGLSPDTDYVFGVAAVRPGAGGQGRILEVVGTTQCSPPSEGPSSVNVTNGTTPGEFLVSWENPPSNSSSCGSGEGGIRIYFTRSDIPSGISKRAADPNENSVDIPFDPPMSEHTLTLEPYSQYLIQVVVYNKDSETPRGEGFTQTTEEMRKRIIQQNLRPGWDAASLLTSMEMYRDTQLRYTQTKPERLDTVIVDVEGNKYEITEGVTKDSEFEIEVRVLNGAGYGEWSPLKTSLLDTGTAASNVPLIAGIVIGIIVVILLIIIIVMALRACKRKREKKIGAMNSTELVDNVLYESNLPLDHQNSNNAARINYISFSPPSSRDRVCLQRA
eukprot:XP_011667320.1 PREDICTED: uncharacterized protein LOC105439714 [Strongylocentrotus purpuratus]